MLPIVGPIRYEALPVFLLYHCVNIAVLLTAVVLYLHPFDAARPSILDRFLSCCCLRVAGDGRRPSAAVLGTRGWRYRALGSVQLLSAI